MRERMVHFDAVANLRVVEQLAFETWGRQQGNVNEGDLAIAACRAKTQREMAEADYEAIKQVLAERATR